MLILPEEGIQESALATWRLFPAKPYQHEMLRIEQGVRTHEAIGRELGLSKQAMVKIEQKALQKCRAWCAARGYVLSDLLPTVK